MLCGMNENLEHAICWIAALVVVLSGAAYFLFL